MSRVCSLGGMKNKTEAPPRYRDSHQETATKRLPRQPPRHHRPWKIAGTLGSQSWLSWNYLELVGAMMCHGGFKRCGPLVPWERRPFIGYDWNFEADKKAIETHFGHSCQTLGKMHHLLSAGVVFFGASSQANHLANPSDFHGQWRVVKSHIIPAA